MHKKERSIQTIALEFIKDKNEQIFSELIHRLKPGLLTFIQKYIPNDSDSREEIVACTFINVWEKINQYNDKFNFSTWVYAIAKNEVLGFLRISKRTVSHDKLLENHSKLIKLYYQPFYTTDLECIGPSGENISIELYNLTIKEINNLEEPYKTVMVEREVNQKQLQDIAEVLGWNLNTVKTRLRKARQEISDTLHKKYPELIESYYENLSL